MMLNNHNDYENQQFKQLTLEQHQFKGIYFDECVFEDCRFSETAFEQCQFNDCRFERCDFSLCSWDGSTFQNGRFLHSKLIGIDWTRLTWSKFVKDSPFTFEDCVLDYGTFIGLTLQKQRMISCSLKEVDFTEADLSKASFKESMLTGSHFRNTKLTKANFQLATNYHINPKINEITKAQFTLPEAVNLLESMDIELIDNV